MHNIHISLTEFKNETRVLKEIKTLADYKIIETTAIYAIHSEGLEKYIKYSEPIKNFKILIKVISLKAIYYKA